MLFMKCISVLSCFLLFSFSYPFEQNITGAPEIDAKDTIPVILPAVFLDDYGIKYSISDSLWIQYPSSRYHILRWDKEKQYIIAKNDAKNKSDGRLYTRIDYMKFTGMEPYIWGFCLSVYNAATDSIAEFGPNTTDRVNPRKGCNGFPFSRMKKSE